ncbi:MAG: hypothetical protein D6710_04110, partial [Nitrospirae bacterium]
METKPPKGLDSVEFQKLQSLVNPEKHQDIQEVLEYFWGLWKKGRIKRDAFSSLASLLLELERLRISTYGEKYNLSDIFSREELKDSQGENLLSDHYDGLKSGELPGLEEDENPEAWVSLRGPQVV